MPTPLSDPVAALGHRLHTSAGQPLITFYDETSGERVELSTLTTVNWVTKLANLLTGDLELDPDAVVRIDLPTHWQSSVVALGAWTAGIGVATGATGAADVVVVGPDAVTAYADEPDHLPAEGNGHVLACSLRPLGGRFVTPLPVGWLDFASEVPPQPDLLVEPRPLPAVATTTPVRRTPARLMAAGAEMAEHLGLRSGGRLATDLNPARDDGLVNVAACLAVGASLVLMSGADAARRVQLTQQEQITAQRWTDS